MQNKTQQHGNVFVILLAAIALLIALAMYSSHRKEQQQLAEEQQRQAEQAALVAAEQAEKEALAAAEQQRIDAERQALQERLEQEQKQKDILLQSLNEVDALHARWVDAVKVADSTARIALSTHVATMQNLRREAQELIVAPCLDDAKSTLLSSMDMTIEGFLTFMTIKGDAGQLLASTQLTNATAKLNTFVNKRQQCF